MSFALGPALMSRGPPMLSSQWSSFFIHRIHAFERKQILDNDKIIDQRKKTISWITDGIQDTDYELNLNNAYDFYIPTVYEQSSYNANDLIQGQLCTSIEATAYDVVSGGNVKKELMQECEWLYNDLDKPMVSVDLPTPKCMKTKLDKYYKNTVETTERTNKRKSGDVLDQSHRRLLIKNKRQLM